LSRVILIQDSLKKILENPCPRKLRKDFSAGELIGDQKGIIMPERGISLLAR
jgi:hypothetical protein